jgi:hypothetical protein
VRNSGSGKEAGETIDVIPVIRDKMQKIKDSLKNFSNIRTQCSNLEKATGRIRSISDEMEGEISSQLADMEREISKAMSNSEE